MPRLFRSMVLSNLLRSFVILMASYVPFSVAMTIGRRALFQKGATSIAGSVPFLFRNPALSYAIDASEKQEVDFQAFRVNPDSSASLNPTLTVLNKSKLLKLIASASTKTNKGGAIWLGEHHNSVKDHILQADMIRDIYNLRSRSNLSQAMAIGLEQVQIKFQSILDDYVDGNISANEMKTLVEWETRWQWPFEAYLPIFSTAQELGIRLVALNVNSEDLADVEKGGLPGLSGAKLQQYITDPRGFAEFTKSNQFREYVDYVIRPSYDLHKAMGLLKYTISGQMLDEEMPFRNFYSGRILWDEAMAANAYRWTKENPGGLIVGLVGADHVKFDNGIVGRYLRLAGDTRDCTSIMLNPTLIDTRPSGSVGNILDSDSSLQPNTLTLQLRYVKDGVDLNSPARLLPSSTGGVMPLADYIVLG